MCELFRSNRERFADLMEDNSLLVLFAGEAPAKRGDEDYPFAPQRNFYYLTGIVEPGVILTMHKNGDGAVTETLYLRRFDPVMSRWIGAELDAEEAGRLSGISRCAWLDEFEAALPPLFIRHGADAVYIDMENRSMTASLSPDLRLAARLREGFPGLRQVNAYPMLAGLRAIKSEAEVSRIRRAVEITGESFTAMMSHLRPGMMEYELEAHYDYVIKKNGCRDRAFATILAAGQNATVLHYSDNNCPINDGDLVLIDFGAQYGWYSADVTRTIPASGRFTERQKQIYNIVLEGNRRVIGMIRPGTPFKALNESLREYYAGELKNIGLISGAEELTEYYFHGVSHMLGLETHDIGRGAEGELKPGMVLTVEPGLYIASEGIGVRIEDDVLVTEDGCEVLTKDIIKTVEDIETFMANR